MGEHKRNPMAQAVAAGLAPRREEQAPQQMSLNIQLGHNATHVLMQFSRKIDNISMTAEQTEEHIKTLQIVLDHFRQSQAAANDAPKIEVAS